MSFRQGIPFLSFITVTVTLLLLQACGPKSPFSQDPGYSSQDSCGFVQNVYGERISWKRITPIRLYIHESVPKQFYASIERAIKDWETEIGKPLFQIAQYSVAGPLVPRQDGVSTIYWMPTWEDNKSAEQARTSIYWVGDEIREADIRINAKDFTFYDGTPTAARDVHLESLLVHELGHVLGLKHKDNVGSVMATYLASQTVRKSIASIDKQDIGCEY